MKIELSFTDLNNLVIVHNNKKFRLLDFHTMHNGEIMRFYESGVKYVKER